MNVVEIHEIHPDTRITSVADTAMYLNLMYHDTVEELLEAFNEWNDFDIIAEVVDALNLKITAVVESTNGPGNLIHGYINQDGVCA